MRTKIYLSILFLLVVTFQLVAQPKIASFSPSTGDIVTTVTINGSNFNTTPTSNLVRFGVIQASVLTATASELPVNFFAIANFGTISLLNKATGLIDKCTSTLPVNPLAISERNKNGLAKINAHHTLLHECNII